MHTSFEDVPLGTTDRTEPFSLAEILSTLRRICDEIDQETGLISEEQACLVADICTRFGGGSDELAYVLGINANLITQPLSIVTDPTPLNAITHS